MQSHLDFGQICSGHIKIMTKKINLKKNHTSLTFVSLLVFFVQISDSHYCSASSVNIFKMIFFF